MELDIHLKVLTKYMVNLRQVSLCKGRDSNPALPDYNCRGLNLE
jgi:hypothetical protein